MFTKSTQRQLTAWLTSDTHQSRERSLMSWQLMAWLTSDTHQSRERSLMSWQLFIKCIVKSVRSSLLSLHEGHYSGSIDVCPVTFYKIFTSSFWFPIRFVHSICLSSFINIQIYLFKYIPTEHMAEYVWTAFALCLFKISIQLLAYCSICT